MGNSFFSAIKKGYKFYKLLQNSAKDGYLTAKELDSMFGKLSDDFKIPYITEDYRPVVLVSESINQHCAFYYFSTGSYKIYPIQVLTDFGVDKNSTIYLNQHHILVTYSSKIALLIDEIILFDKLEDAFSDDIKYECKDNGIKTAKRLLVMIQDFKRLFIHAMATNSLPGLTADLHIKNKVKEIKEIITAVR